MQECCAGAWIGAARIRSDLEAIESDPDFSALSSDLTERWTSEGVGLGAVEPVLRFMEAHPDIEYGMPGGLVHFVERFHQRGYEELLLRSVLKQPTWITTWMLNRLIMGTHDAVAHQQYVQAMKQVSTHVRADPDTREQAVDFLREL